MSLTILIICLNFLLAQNLFDEGVNWYNKRADGSNGIYASSIPIDNAIKVFQKDIDNNRNKNSIVYLLKSYFFKGAYVYKDIELKKEIFNKGKKLAENYLEIYPESADIRYWYLVNLGRWAEVYGKIKAAREGVAGIMKEQSEKIIELDPNYKNGGGYFMLGAVHLKSPYIPIILSWPNKNKALEYLQLALDTGDATLVQKIYLAQALYESEKKEQAKKILYEVVHSDLNQNEIVEQLNDIEEAKQLLKTF